MVGGRVGRWPGSRVSTRSFALTFLMPTMRRSGSELGDAVDEQERVTVRQNPLDDRVIERQLIVH